MKGRRVILGVLLFLAVFHALISPVLASNIGSDEFLNTYDPEKIYEIKPILLPPSESNTAKSQTHERNPNGSIVGSPYANIPDSELSTGEIAAKYGVSVGQAPNQSIIGKLFSNFFKTIQTAGVSISKTIVNFFKSILAPIYNTFIFTTSHLNKSFNNIYKNSIDHIYSSLHSAFAYVYNVFTQNPAVVNIQGKLSGLVGWVSSRFNYFVGSRTSVEPVPVPTQTKSKEQQAKIIKHSQEEVLIKKLETKYKVKIKGDDIKWSMIDLKNLDSALSKIPEDFYKDKKIVRKKTASDNPIVRLFSGNACTVNELSTGGYTVTEGYVGGGDNTTVNICEIAKPDNEDDKVFKGTIIHEFTHIREKDLSSMGIGYGINVANDKLNILFEYYDKLFNLNDSFVHKIPVIGEITGSWMLDSKIVNEYTVPISCDKFDDRMEKSPPAQIFVSVYDCKVANAAKPEEELAEAVRAFTMNRPLLEHQDKYDYSVKGAHVSGNLDRAKFINSKLKVK